MELPQPSKKPLELTDNQGGSRHMKKGRCKSRSSRLILPKASGLLKAMATRCMYCTAAF